MDVKLIEKLEEEIKELHLNPKREKHSSGEKSSEEIFSSFWLLRVKPVVE